MSSYFILDVIRITFKTAMNKSSVELDRLLSESQIRLLKSTKVESISIDLHLNESINESTQIIINRLYLELLNIDKFNFFYENDLILMMNNHKIWVRIMSCKFQHSVQEISIYERYKWTLSLDALFHFQMNMIDAILKIHYELIKFSLSSRSSLRTHAEFWNRKKIRFDNFEFHATQEFIIQNYKTRVVVVFWIVVQRTSSVNELKDLKTWINNAFASKLLNAIEQIRLFLMKLDLDQCENDELRNHILFCQHVKSYLWLKYVISRDDIDFLSFVFVKVVVLFHDSSKFNYQTKTLYMFWLISIDIISSNLKKIILTNSLINISRLKNKFISMNLHLKLHNEYMKKIIRDRRISFLNLEYLFEYSARFASTIRRQLIWMKHFHHVFTNIRHATIDQEDDLVKLTYELHKEMIYFSDRRLLSSNQVKNLFANDDRVLRTSIEKFNRKLKHFIHSLAFNAKKNEDVHCELTKLLKDENLNDWIKDDEFDALLNHRSQTNDAENV
jgi:hypothetical protein